MYGYGALPADHGLFVTLVSHGGVAHVTLTVGGIDDPDDLARRVHAHVSKLADEVAASASGVKQA